MRMRLPSSASGNRGAGEDAHRLARADRSGKAAAGGRFANDDEFRADCYGVFGAQRIAVHGRRVEGWLRQAGGEVLRQNAAIGVVQGNGFRCCRRHGLVEQALQGGGDGEKAHDVASSRR